MDITSLLISICLLIPSTICTWSPWSTWSDCSRTCDGGVSNQMRQCLASSRKQCLGEEIRYKTCNHEPCPKDAKDFRSEQCKAFNGIKYKGQFYKWIPSYDKHDPCALICKAKGQDLTVILSPKVLDGTRCDKHSKDMCINGLCKSVGCDNELNSKKIDECGVCGGDGSSCKQQMIPESLSSEEEIIPLNRHFKTEPPRQQYSNPHPLQQRDIVKSLAENSNDALKSADNFDGLLSDDSNSYERNQIVHPNRLNVLSQSVEVQLYNWVESSYSECSVTCGEGKQQTSVKCINSKTQEVSPDQFCPHPKPPHRARICNLKSCQAKWIVGKWGECSTTCGGGISVRNVFCVMIGIGGKIEKTDETLCLRKRPPTKEKCNTRPCPEWQPGQWSVCSVTCGVGFQFRPSVCKKYSETDVCPDNNKPTDKQKCHTGVICVDNVIEHPDEPFIAEPDIDESNEEDNRYFGGENQLKFERPQHYEDFDSLEYNVKEEDDDDEYYRGNFNLDEYSEQGENALEGRDSSTEVYSPFYDRGDEIMERNEGSGSDREIVTIDSPSYYVGEWGDCDVACGRGSKHRTVECRIESTNGYKVVAESLCTGSRVTRPEDTIQCDGPCDKNYYIGEWSQCDVTCGHGNRYRTVECRVFMTYSNSIQVLPDSSCSGVRPASREECIEENCPITVDGVSRNGYAWQFAGYQPCTVTCGGGLREPTFACVRPDPQIHITVDMEFCSRLPLPTVLKESCNDHSCPASLDKAVKPRWQIYDYGPCSHLCGGGLSQRQVDCVRDDGNSITPVPDRLCLASKPGITKLCNLISCPPSWATGPYSKCSVTCGKGIMVRNVTCQQIKPPLRKSDIKNDAYCSAALKPQTTAKCEKQDCIKTPIMRPDSSYYVQLLPRKQIRFAAGSTLVIIPGTVLRLRCPVSNFDKTKIVWTRNGDYVSRKGRVKKSKRGVLHIRGTEMIDAGVYTCHAGSLSATTTLRFHRETTALDKYLFRENVNARDPEFLDKFHQQIKQTGSNRKEEYTEPYLFKHFDQYSLPFTFISGNWGPCSKNCGGAGLQSRQITCELNMDHYYLVVNDRYCRERGFSKPLSTQDCGYQVCPEWKIGVWSNQCTDKTCLQRGVGVKTRPLYCVSYNESQLNHRLCNQDKKPVVTKPCAMSSCDANWNVSSWTSCSRSCGGEGIKTRSLQCVWEPNQRPANGACNLLPKPAVMMPCHTPKCDDTYCRDESNYCSLVQMLNLCRYSEYRTKCCASCTAIGRGPIRMRRYRFT